MARVLLFGRLADLAGWREQEMDVPDTVHRLRDQLAHSTPALSALSEPQVQVAVDQVLVRGDAALAGVREVAFLPPFSGG